MVRRYIRGEEIYTVVIYTQWLGDIYTSGEEIYTQW